MNSSPRHARPLCRTPHEVLQPVSARTDSGSADGGRRRRPPRGRGSFQRFIGVTPRPELADRLGPTNAAARAGTADAMRPETRRMLAQRYEEPNQRLAELLGTGLMMWIQ